MTPTTSRHRRSSTDRRGNTLVLVTAILVLLVIIATAYISRTQGGRVIAAAQRKAIDREDRADVAAGVVAREIADTLFPRLVDPSDPGVANGAAATSSTPRISRPFWNGQKLDRFMVDPQVNAAGAPLAPYNYAPYETRAWTNWPDSGGGNVPFGAGAGNGRIFTDNGLAIGDDNPVGNPGFGDSRWLRSSEPERAYDTLGQLGADNQTGQQGFTHWSHLSWPATPENGWRVCFDIANVAPFRGNLYDPADPANVLPNDGFTLTTTAAQLFASGAANDYLLIQQPVALQTPYEQWLPGVTPLPYAGAGNFIGRRNAWFGSPANHFQNAYNANALPNFIRLNDLGPKRRTFQPGSDRNVVERTLADADGDGFTDSFWFLLPGTSEDGVRQVAAVAVVDNASMVDVNVATRFDRWSTAGHTPADIALTSRLVQPGAQATVFGDNAQVYDPFDTWTGLFSDPQNASPVNQIWGLGYANDAQYQVQPGTFDAPSTLKATFDPLRFGDSTSVAASWLRQTGVLNQNAGATGFAALEAPYRSLLVSFGDGDPERAAFDRRRYFSRRQNDGGLFTVRSDANGNPLPVDQWGVGNVPPRGFTDADELELRMFAASNYGPAVSTLERTVNEPWNYQSNFLRSSLARSESVENFLDYFDGNENTPWPPQQGIAIGDQLSALELLRDNRHRITTYSATRNDLRPLHLRPTALYNPDYDYAFGRLRADATTPPNPQANQLAFDVRKQKLDLRAPSNTPLTEFESILYRFFPGPFNIRNVGDSAAMLSGVWPDSLGVKVSARVELDRAYRFREELRETIGKAASAVVRDDAGTTYAQSFLGSNYEDITLNQQDYLRTQLLAASWSANIDTFRDDRPRPAVSYNLAASSGGLGAVQPIEVDTPIFPDWAPRVDKQTESFLPQELNNLCFPGLEKQPFIMESFFGLVYPPSRITAQTAQQLGNDAGYQQLLQQEGQSEPNQGDDTIPFGFQGSGDKWVDASSDPAIIFAIQLANPFEEPVPLHDLFIRIGDSSSLNQCLNLAKIPSPHPAARVNDIDPATGGTRVNPYYFPSELFLGPTQPDAPRTAIVFGIIPPGNNIADFEDEFGMPYEEFHAKWMDFLDIEPGALFGWDATLPMSQHQTLVFDASPETYARANPVSAGIPFTPPIAPLVGLTPNRWFSDPDRSVELLRFVVDPLAAGTVGGGSLPTSGYLYAIDRLDNELTGEKIEFSDQMKRLVEDDFAPTMPQEFTFTYGGPPDRNEWSGIRLEGGDLLCSWVRAGRAWGWDVNRNGLYDMNETSPRYIFPEIPEDDWVRTEVEGVQVGQGLRQVSAEIINWDEDPDTPWMARSYLSPLALVPTPSTAGGEAFSFDFATIRAKPTHLTTATAIQPGGGQQFTVDYDAGFPVLADGSVRTQVDPLGWPGRPAGSYRWVLMDKGQDPEEMAPGNRAGMPTGVDGNANGVDDGLETYQRIWLEKDQWAYPLQMLQKDADFEQVGEVFNTFLWGHAITHRPGVTVPPTFSGIRLLPTYMTFGEIMNSTKANDPLPVVRADLTSVGVPNSSRIHTNRFHADPGNLTAQVGAAVNPFRPFTQVVEVSAVSEPWTPLLPAGLSVLDGLVCDGPGCNYQFDQDGDGSLDPVELLAVDDARYGNAAGYSGRGTRGLINLNTAPVEVLRTLPHMSRLVYNDRLNWPGTSASGIAGGWVGYAPSVPLAGDVGENAVPRGVPLSNPQWVRVAESIEQYRAGGGVYSGGGVEPRRVDQITTNPVGILTQGVLRPYYDDRGSFNYTDTAAAPQFAGWVADIFTYPEIPGTPGLFPGMRRGAGICSVGELCLLSRSGLFGPPSWPQRSASIDAAALNPYRYQGDLSGLPGGQAFPALVGSNGQPWDPSAISSDVNVRLGLGWRPQVDASSGTPNGPALQTDARLSTDRRNVSWSQDRWNPSLTVEVPDNVAGDAEEANLLFAGLSNLVSVRSDVFTVYLKVRSFKQNPVTGVWNATDPEFIVDDSRYVFVVD
ncbi:MAG: hypothetical protein RLZZ461_110, partial [Planctomycetota bacterium]